MSSELASLAAEFGLSVTQEGCLESHYRLLLKWNRTINLVSRGDEAQLVTRHYGESLFLASQLPSGPLSVVDVGSGAGFPGIPLAVARPDCTVTLVESHQRKAVFLTEATRGWGNVAVLCRRAEEVAGRFDLLVSRAVRWDDLVALPLAASFALLLGAQDAVAASKSRATARHSSLTWIDPLPIPGSRQRVLLMGGVPRETAP
jgi:16S rRNA (guanine527-N7)-methyltransferase